VWNHDRDHATLKNPHLKVVDRCAYDDGSTRENKTDLALLSGVRSGRAGPRPSPCCCPLTGGDGWPRHGAYCWSWSRHRASGCPTPTRTSSTRPNACVASARGFRR
jgi:hypothetical protein